MSHDELTELKKKKISDQLNDIDEIINQEEDYYHIKEIFNSNVIYYTSIFINLSFSIINTYYFE